MRVIVQYACPVPEQVRRVLLNNQSADKASILIRVLIADDHDVVRKGVRNVLLSGIDIEVCGEAANGKEAIELAVMLQPDVIILDLSMPVLGGFGAAVELRRLLPDVPIIFYSMHEGPHLVKQAQQIGVRGFVSKSRISDTLTKAIDAVLLRKQPFFPDSQEPSG